MLNFVKEDFEFSNLFCLYMINYYFYNNLKKNNLKKHMYLYLFSLVFELYNIVLNIIALRNLFFNINSNLSFKYLKKKFNYNFFFFKISIISKILIKYLSFNRKIKTWRLLIFFFFIIMNSFVLKSSFFEFNFNINLNEYNLINYSFKKKIILFKIKKNPIKFIFFYFYIHIYKIFLASKMSLFIVKNIIYLDTNIVSFFNLIKVNKFLNYKLRYVIHI